MKIKHIVILYVISLLIAGIGAFLKIMHWPGATVIFILAACLQVISYILIIWKVFTSDYFKKFLNS